MMEMKAILEISIAIGFISQGADQPCIVHSHMIIVFVASPITTNKRISTPQINISKTPPLSREREAILSQHMPSNNKEAIHRITYLVCSKLHQTKQTLPQPTPPNKSVVKNKQRQ